MTDLGRFALFGPPGAGKSTIRRLSQRVAADLGFALHHFRLADPLYAAQEAIYRLSGRPLADPSVQDGRLLNLLGVEMRRINPEVLADHARTTLTHIGRELETATSSHAVLCDDMRPPDAGFLAELGFQFVRISLDSATTQNRRLLRGDLTLGSPDDPNELGVGDVIESFTIDNSGALDKLATEVRRFWQDRLG